jgi:hemin uptake protein HemP
MTTEPPEQDTDTMTSLHTASIRIPVEPGIRVLPSGAIPTDFLFQGSQEILISHNGEQYRLRITKNGKLILTK